MAGPQPTLACRSPRGFSVPRLPVAFVRLLFLLFGVLAVAQAPAGAAESALPPAEQQRIEAIIASVEKAAELKFVRLGSVYDSATAARFLRAKWQFNRDTVTSADDFIRKIGTRSGTSGPSYRVRRPDGSEEDSEQFLYRLLASVSR